MKVFVWQVLASAMGTGLAIGSLMAFDKVQEIRRQREADRKYGRR